MNWLQATLAFALVMLVLATVVTIVLETAYRLLSIREKGFRLMMERLYDDVLQPRIAAFLSGVTPEQARERFLDAVTRNQAYEQKPNRLRALVQPGELSSMTMMQFADRLADTEVGKAIAQTGAAQIENAINDLAQKFERFGQASSQRFQDHARFWCVLVSILVAFVANVDAVRVFRSLLHDDELTSGVIAQYAGLADEHASRPQSVAESMQDIDELRRQNVVGADETEQFKKNIATARLKTAELRNTGLPLSISYWPFCVRSADDTESTAGQRDPACGSTMTQGQSSWRDVLGRIASASGLGWFFSVLLAGVLIGLGAPFWFDLARGLTRGAQLLKAAGSGERAANAAATPAATDAKAPPPRTPVEAFTVAIAAAPPVALG